MNAALERLVSSLLYEGYALYPYTPAATKNATPTPFGIAYPPAYADRNASAFDRVRLECVLAAGEEAEIGLTVPFLQARGARHEAIERRLEVPPTPVRELAAGAGAEFEFDGARTVRGRIRLRAVALDAPGLYRINACVHNGSELAGAESADRATALTASLLSAHVVIEATRGRFVSPLEREGVEGEAVAACESVNSWPVLAGPDDSVILGAAIVLPDHPRIAPESLGGMFDSTEIEEALLLHVHALSDDERGAIAEQDPAVREMVERALGAGREDIFSLHGRLEEVVDEPGHPVPGESEIELDGVTFRKGGKVILRPGRSRDVYDSMLDGRAATIERLYYDSDGDAHIAVTVDGDAAQGLFRETGRYLFFRGHEVEAVPKRSRATHE
jgi:hypothetical protein